MSGIEDFCHRRSVEVRKSGQRRPPLKCILRYAFVDPDRRIDERPSGCAFYLTNATISRILKMKKYSITEASELVGVNRATLYRWIQRKLVPAPLVEVVAGVEITYWTESELAEAKEYKRTKFWGQGKKKNKAKRTKRSDPE